MLALDACGRHDAILTGVDINPEALTCTRQSWANHGLDAGRLTLLLLDAGYEQIIDIDIGTYIHVTYGWGLPSIPPVTAPFLSFPFLFFPFLSFPFLSVPFRSLPPPFPSVPSPIPSHDTLP